MKRETRYDIFLFIKMFASFGITVALVVFAEKYFSIITILKLPSSVFTTLIVAVWFGIWWLLHKLLVRKLTLWLEGKNQNENIKMVHVTINETNVLELDIMRLIEPLWQTVNIYGTYEEYLETLKPFTMEQRYVFAISWFEAEVFNGGFCQFYDNPTGIVWEDAKNGFLAIGSNTTAEIIEKSAKLFGGRPSFDREERWKQMEQIEQIEEDALSKLDDLFYKENYSKLLKDYIRKNQKAFYYDGKFLRR